MCKHEAEAIAQFVWNQLGLYPDETMGHDFYTQEGFAKKLWRDSDGRE